MKLFTTCERKWDTCQTMMIFVMLLSEERNGVYNFLKSTLSSLGTGHLIWAGGGDRVESGGVYEKF